MRLLVLAVLLLPFFCGCNDDEPSSAQIDTSFAKRGQVSRVEDEEGRVRFYCEDTSFVYLQTENQDSLVLLIDDSVALKEFFMELGSFDARLLTKYPCVIADQMVMTLQEPELKVSITGAIVNVLAKEEFPVSGGQPFVMDTLIKLNDCFVEPVTANKTLPLQETRWRAVEITTDSAIHHPSCEYNDVSVIFSEDSIQTEPGDESFGYMNLYLVTGYNTCGFSYNIHTDNALDIEIGACTLGFIETTRDVMDFHNELIKVFNPEGNRSSSLTRYDIQNNILTLTNPETGTVVRLFAE